MATIGVCQYVWQVFVKGPVSLSVISVLVQNSDELFHSTGFIDRSLESLIPSYKFFEITLF
jgi:hypothetical protein